MLKIGNITTERASEVMFSQRRGNERWRAAGSVLKNSKLQELVHFQA